jgi:prepilin peptidase CpaA
MNQFVSRLIISAAVIVCALVAAGFDVKTRRIPNVLCAGGMLAGLLVHLASGGWRSMFASCASLLLCGAVFLMVYVAGGMGAGDVKLIAAQGSLLGLSGVAPLLALTAIAGGVMALVYAGWRGRLRQTGMNVLQLVSHHASRGLEPHPEFNVLNMTTLRLPYALAIGVGSIATLALEASQRHL